MTAPKGFISRRTKAVSLSLGHDERKMLRELSQLAGCSPSRYAALLIRGAYRGAIISGSHECAETVSVLKR